jgi:hypothetical protein
MITNRTPEFTWRKTKEGEWVVCGNASILRKCLKTATQVDVTSRDGKVKYVTITRVGKTFGDGLAYGYTAQPTHATRTSATCDECGGHGATHHRTDSSGIPGIVCGRCSREPAHALSFA